MAGNEDEKNKALAEKAYEAAASTAGEKAKAPEIAAKPESAAPAPDGDPKPTPAVKTAAPKAEAPDKPKVAPAADVKPAALAKAAPEAKVAPAPGQDVKPKSAPPKSAPKAKAAVKAPTPAKAAALAKAKPADKPQAAASKPSATPVAAVKPVPAVAAKPAPAPVKTVPISPVAATAKSAAAQPKSPVFKAAPKTAEGKSPIFAGLFTNFMLEEKTMDMSANFNGIQEAVTEAQAKAKAAFEKSTAVLGEVSDFAKGNVEAVIESGKIFADGMQGIGSELVAEGRAAFETVSGDIKELAAAKSPTDFFKIQGDVMRKNFDSAVAYGSKNSEAMLKLMSDVIAPISGRVSLAMEKARQTSL